MSYLNIQILVISRCYIKSDNITNCQINSKLVRKTIIVEVTNFVKVTDVCVIHTSL